MLQRILSLRPLLWIAGILLLAFLTSLTWENQTSYDDGGFGSVAFAVMVPFVLVGQLVGLDFVTSVVASLFVLVAGDLLVRRRLAVRLRVS